MAFSPLTKGQAQASPYNYTWASHTGGVTVSKYMGTTRVEWTGSDDNDAVAKINAHETWIDARGKATHG